MTKYKDIDLTVEVAIKHHQNNDFDKAAELYINLLKKEPDNTNVLYFYGLLLVQTSRFNEARNYLEKILQQKNESQILIDSLTLLGESYLIQNDINKAQSYFEKVLDLKNSDFLANFNLGNIYFTRKNTDEAIKCYYMALREEVNQVEIYTKLVQIYTEKNNIDKIIYCYLKLIELEPKNAYHYFNAGNIYYQKNDAENAFKAYTNAIYLTPDFADAHLNLSTIYQKIFDFKNAEKHLLKALELKDNLLEIYLNLGNLYIDTGETSKAIEISEKGLKKFSQNQSFLFNKRRAQMLEGNIDEGWEYFKLRRIVNEKKELKTYLLDYKGTLKDKRVLVYNDSGFGDSIQFLRYIPELKETGAKVLLKTQKPLVKLIESSDFDVEIISDEQKLTEVEYDFHINLTSLAYLFKRDKNNFPLAKEKYISAEPEKIEEYRKKFFDNNDFKIGIVWYSGVNFLRKSPKDIKYFYPLSKIPGIKFYSFQKTEGKPVFNSLPDDFEIIKLGDDFKDFTETAAAVANIDMFIGMDTVMIHLAAAMGKPTWCMLPDVPNWRWFIQGDTTPWYDNVQLFRQKEPGNWTEVFERIKQQLEKQV